MNELTPGSENSSREGEESETSRSRRNFLLLGLGSVGAGVVSGIVGAVGGDLWGVTKKGATFAWSEWFERSSRKSNRNQLDGYLFDSNARKLQSEMFGVHAGRVAITTGSNPWYAISLTGIDKSRAFGGRDLLPPFIASTAHEFERAAGESYSIIRVVGNSSHAITFDSEWHMGGQTINPALNWYLRDTKARNRLRYEFVEVPNPQGVGVVPRAGVQRVFQQVDENILFTKPTPAKTHSFLVERGKKDRPIGPRYEHGLLRDVPMIVTILPKSGRDAPGRVVLVEGAYGAPQSFDLLFSPEILGPTRNALGRYPFGQVVFRVPVEYRTVLQYGQQFYVEEYGIPEFVGAQPLFL